MRCHGQLAGCSPAFFSDARISRGKELAFSSARSLDKGAAPLIWRDLAHAARPSGVGRGIGVEA